MSSHKSFKSARSEQKKEPITFDIEGEEFSVPRPLPGFVMLDFAAFTIDDDEDNLQAFTDFFEQAFENKAELKRFRSTCSKYRVPLKVHMENDEVDTDELSLLSIVQYLIEEDTGRPTEQPSDSQQSLANTGPSSDTAA